jgi:uncharacterized alpha-E superfamily protein
MDFLEDFADDIEFRKLLGRQDDIVNLTVAALELARDAYPEIVFESVFRWIDDRAGELRGPVARAGSDEGLLGELGECLAKRHEIVGSREIFEHADGSFLNRVIERKTGIPISLSVLYMAVAERTGIALKGVAAPGHFLTCYETIDSPLFVDAFARGRIRTFDETAEWLAETQGVARENARTTREQISSEMWEQINRLYLFVQSNDARKLLISSPHEFFKRVVNGSHLFQGITEATMTHGEGWEFIRIGTLLERADCTSRILDVKYHILLPSGESVGGNIDTIQWMAVLKSCSALEAYCKLYVSQVAPWKVAEFLIAHQEFPRSIRYSVDSLDAALHRISGVDESRYANEAERLSGRLRSDVDYVTIGEIFEVGLHEYLTAIQKRLVEVSEAMYATYCASLDGA